MVALCVLGLLETSAAYGPDPGRLLLVTALVVPLLWRRTRPGLMVYVVLATFLVQVPVVDVRVLEETFVCYVALIWAVYSSARHAMSPPVLGAVAGGLTTGLTDRSVLSGVIALGILLAFVLLGRGVRVRARTRETLERQKREIAAATSAAAAAHASEARSQIAAEVRATLVDHVHDMRDQARWAAQHLPCNPGAAVEGVAVVEAAGRAALQKMRLTLRVLRDVDDHRLRRPGPAEEPAPLPRGSWSAPVFAAGLVLALLAVVTVNVTAGFTGPEDYVFPMLLVVLGGAGILAMRRQSDLVAGVRAQTDELRALNSVVARTSAIDEQLRLARELHDVVAHHLMVMVVQAGAARRSLESGRAGAPEALAVIERTGAEVVTELSSVLDVATPDASGGPAHGMSELERLVDRVRTSGLDVELVVTGERLSLPGGLDLVAHRIVQESLTNVMRHANASLVRVLVHYSRDRLTIDVSDNGRGLEAASEAGTATGLGIAGMRERAALYGGRCDVTEPAGGGLRVLAMLPLASASVTR